MAVMAVPRESVATVEEGRCSPTNSELLSYERILRFFENPDTADQHSRQLALLKKLCRQNHWGYPLRDLPNVALLLDVTHKRIDVPGFEAALSALIELAGKPYLRYKANEEFFTDGNSALQQLMAALSRLLGSPSAKVKIQACATLTALTEGKDYLRSNDPHVVKVLGGEVREELRPLPKEFNNSMLLQFGMVERAAEQLAMDAEDYLSAVNAESAAVLAKSHRLELRRTIARAKNRGDENYDEFWEGEEESLDEVGDKAKQKGNSNGEKPSVRKRKVVLALLTLVRDFSACPANVPQLVGAGVMGTTIELIGVTKSMRDSLLGVAVDVMWNCLDASAEALKAAPPPLTREDLVERWRRTNAGYRLATERALVVLKDLLLKLLAAGYRSRDKELRNALLIILSFVSRGPSIHPIFRTTGLLDVLIAYATVTEAGQYNPWPVDVDPHNFATTSAVDLEFKRLVWGLLSNLVGQDVENSRLIADSPFLNVLLMYIRRLPSDKPINRSAPICVDRLPESHLISVQLQALAALVNLTPLVAERFIPLGGAKALLALLTCKPLQADRTRRGLLLLQAISGLPGLSDDLSRCGAVPVVLNCLNDTEATDAMKLSGVRALATLGASSEVCRAALREEGGLRVLIDALDEYTRKRRQYVREIAVEPLSKEAVRGLKREGIRTKNPATIEARPPPLIIGLVDCVWSAVIGDRQSEEMFLDEGGIEALLDLLDYCPSTLGYQVLGALSDLLRSAESVAYAKGWRSDTNLSTAGQLLLRVWVEEEARLQVPRPDGIITNLPQPLGSHSLPSTEAYTDFRSLSSSSSTVGGAFSHLKTALEAAREEEGHVLAKPLPDLRARLAACLDLLGDVGQWRSKLSEEEGAALAVADNYVIFRQGETWGEVAQNLAERCIKPVAADALLMEGAVQHKLDVAQHVQAHQAVLRGQALNEEKKAEEAVYKDILTQREQELHQLRLKRYSGALGAKHRRRSMFGKTKVGSIDSTATGTGTGSTGGETGTLEEERQSDTVLEGQSCIPEDTLEEEEEGCETHSTVMTKDCHPLERSYSSSSGDAGRNETRPVAAQNVDISSLITEETTALVHRVESLSAVA